METLAQLSSVKVHVHCKFGIKSPFWYKYGTQNVNNWIATCPSLNLGYVLSILKYFTNCCALFCESFQKVWFTICGKSGNVKTFKKTLNHKKKSIWIIFKTL